MSRRGRGRDHRSWSSHCSRGAARPPGLRGRDIGLYFRDQQRLHGKIKKNLDYVINLRVPPAIVTGMENNLKLIQKLREECNIPLSQFVGLNSIKIEKDCDLSNTHSLNDDTSTPSTSSSHLSDVKEMQPELSASSVKTEPVEAKDIKTEGTSNKRLLSLRGAGDFKYGYEDIITGTFDEKLDECLAQKSLITKRNSETDDLSIVLHADYQNMINMREYKKFKAFRETLPTYKKSEYLLRCINNNQVIVISGETGCGKSTQVPQLILDQAIENKQGGYVRVLVTQPRRIAASSLAMRVAQERAELMGAGVGYAVRLERVDARARGSIMFCTTGILLTTLEVDQGLTNYSHVILDEVHERDCDIDLAMFMLKKVLMKRKDLKLILMSATVDADTLSVYFDNCPMVHIEGLAFPVKDVYMEEILEMTKFKLPEVNRSLHRYQGHARGQKKKKLADDMQKDIQYKATIAPWLESIKKDLSPEVYKTLQDSRIEELNIDLIHELMVTICRGEPGAILVFLPGIIQISSLVRLMTERGRFPPSQYLIYPLHSKLPSLQQHKIFERPPANKRKIIIATNIAETSITVDDIVYVIDCGKLKYSGLNVEENVSTLLTEWAAQANLRQRRGRAGRCQPGICYHLVTSYRARNLEERLLPEIQRNPLLEPVLALKKLRLGTAAEALKLLPSPPAERTVTLAVKHLQQCGALDYAEKLTPLGWHLARLPVHPAAGKLLILGALFGCLDRAASVAAVWGFKDPFQIVIGKEQEVDDVKKHFAMGEGSDHVAISEAITQWEMLPRSDKRHFAYDNFLSNNTLELLSDMKKQFGSNLQQMGFLPTGDIFSDWENRNKNNLSLFKAIIAASLYPNIATAKWACLRSRNPNKPPIVKGRLPQDGYAYIHPSSVMAHKRTAKRFEPSVSACMNPGANWIVYWCIQRSMELYLLEVTLVHTLPLLFFGELSVSKAEKPDECYITISSVKVLCQRHTTDLLCQMRYLLEHVLASKIGVSNTHATVHNAFEDQVLNAVKDLITAEDERAECLNDEEELSESEYSDVGSSSSWRR
ncbi:ATP-dependent DNA/RNA helicase DHX36-like [Anticarsia gemmatalis]|uniref:ATP-dependent DNA/RNA helicase DHX36-like n=1 Tax=Anticarsia gemmatalis TaxID=129554 RepID=UPI003F757C3A